MLLPTLLSALVGTAVAQQQAAQAYTPKSSPCPANTNLVRSAGATNQTLGSAEAGWISSRKANVLPGAWNSYLQTVQVVANATGTPLPSYVASLLASPNTSPTLGIATSGGGYRAAIFGAGVLNALDGRNTTSTKIGTGGLLQTASYLAGLSGGSWLVTSATQAGFPSLLQVALGTNATSGQYSGWLAQYSLMTPGNAVQTSDYVPILLAETTGKHSAGFPVTITDIWARTLSRHFANGTTVDNFFDTTITHGAGLTFSSIAQVQVPAFAQHNQPFPIVIADSVSNAGNKSNTMNESGVSVPLTNPIYEFNPFEMGSFDPMLSAFIPTQYLGSVNNSVCITGYDQMSFVEGISSSLYNSFNISGVINDTSTSTLIGVLETVMPQVGIRYDSAAVPNPFFGVMPQTYIDSNQTLLSLVDGGEDGEISPIQPLLVKARGVDTLLVIDAPADTSDNWAIGDSLIATQDRVNLLSSAYSFPPVPTDSATFAAQNLTKRPTFFGCNSSTAAPLMIYIANGGPPLNQSPMTNTSTSQIQYDPSQTSAMLDQVYDIATQGIPVQGAGGSLTKDPEWPVCLACAVVDRARSRNGTARSGVCATCLNKYCWS